MEIKLSSDTKTMEDELRSKLALGETKFLFKKKGDETVRYARGTTNKDLFDYEFKGTKRKKPDNIIDFWDIDKGEWRSCCVENIILIIKI